MNDLVLYNDYLAIDHNHVPTVSVYTIYGEYVHCVSCNKTLHAGVFLSQIFDICILSFTTKIDAH